MKLDFARNARRNTAAMLVNKTIALLFPFLNRTLFLFVLGPEYLGLNGLFGSVLGVLMLAEMGFATAVISSMYKPIADDDRELVCAYLRYYRSVYRWVGLTIFAFGLCLMPFLGRLVHGSVPADVNLHVLFFIHLVNTAASYFLFAYRRSVIDAHNRNSVTVNIQTAMSIAQYLAVFAVLLVFKNYYWYVATAVAFTVAQNLLIYAASRRLYPDISPRGELSPARRRAVARDVRSIFLHKLGGIVSMHSGNLVVSSCLGLVAVAAFGNYYYVITAVGGLVSAIYAPMLGGFGNKIHTESKEMNFALLMKVREAIGMVVEWCAAMMAALYGPFIALWSAGRPELVRHALTPVLMITLFCVNQSRQALLSFKAGAAMWRQDRFKPLAGALSTLAVSIVLANVLPDAFKIDGVVAAAIATFVFIETPWESHVVFTGFFTPAEARRYWLAQARFFMTVPAVCLATWGAARFVEAGGIRGLCLRGALAAAVAALCVAAAHFPLAVRAVRRFRRNRPGAA